MKIQQLHYIDGRWKDARTDHDFYPDRCRLVLAFGAPLSIQKDEVLSYLKTRFPLAEIVLASTAGEILECNVFDHSIAVTAIQFDKTGVKAATLNVQDRACSHVVGRELMKQLHRDELSSVFVISDGTLINGSHLISGFNEVNPGRIAISGGLAGDGEQFTTTYVGLNSRPVPGTVVAIGFYGTSLETSYGTAGGWSPFGPEKLISRAENNVLFELNGRNALELYKEYLGPYANELPASALLFPLALSLEDSKGSVVRTILSVNEEQQSMVFAGNMPVGSKVRLMRSNFDKLISASSLAAKACFESNETKPGLAILISCVGRKLILQERTDEEVRAAEQIFGSGTFLTGFYSYGEISPSNPNEICALHNQTMTITTFSES
jgi:hypothetical protein